MPSAVFYRGAYTELWLRLTADEELGLIDTDYVEDYDGVDGQITLHHLATLQDYPVSLLPRPDLTPSVPNDVFEGPVDLSLIPDGLYEVRGRLRDTLGNWTILNAVAAPTGTERVDVLTLRVLPGTALKMVVHAPGLTLRGVAAVMVSRRAAGALGTQRVASVVGAVREYSTFGGS